MSKDNLEQRTLSPALHTLHILPGGSTVKAGTDTINYISSEWNDPRLPTQRPDMLSVYAKRLGYLAYMTFAVGADVAKYFMIYQPLFEKIF